MADGKDRDIWNAKDCAADLYPFLVLTAWYTRPTLYEGRMQEILLTETALTARIGRLPDTYSFSKQGFAEARVDTASIMFGGSEYVKDGLMPITELLGVTPWRARMLGIVDDLWRYAPVETPFGRIVSLDPEVNGDMLLVLSRLYWMTRDARYLEYATRLGDYYLLRRASPDARLRDAAAARPRQRGRVGAHGALRDAAEGAAGEGGGVSRADPRDARPHPRGGTQRGRPVLQRDRSARRASRSTRASPTTSATCSTATTPSTSSTAPTAYRDAVRKALGALDGKYRGFDWEDLGADGDADAIEGALYLYNREPVPSAAAWMDYQISGCGASRTRRTARGWSSFADEGSSRAVRRTATSIARR